MAFDRGMKAVQRIALILLVLCAGTALPVQGAGDRDEFSYPETFNHNRTAFPLTGQHRIVPCESCHVGGQYESLSRECSTCHSLPRNHAVNQSAAVRMGGCPTCHTTSGWRFVTFVHPPEAAGTPCQNCHDGRKAPGKPSNHIATTASCNVCHKTRAWSPATFKHDATVAGRCATCHTKPSGHLSTTAQCDTCHLSTAWTPANAMHDASATGNCSSCHSKPTGHFATNAQCDTCHRVTAWTPATFKHDVTAAGKCSTCHAKPTGHVATTSECDLCHKTIGWTPASYANHDNPRLIGGHTGVVCKTCHPTSFDSAYYRDGIQYGFCSNCHRSDYKYPGDSAHRNAGPTFNTSLQKNANCANCHEH
ncbi:MAG: hypothetical protein HY760_01005, partial [Nitrospirae bacterium]|nr:hypothetical protein [Nitrospirota bacterium]